MTYTERKSYLDIGHIAASLDYEIIGEVDGKPQHFINYMERSGAVLICQGSGGGRVTRYLLGGYGGLICIGEDETGYTVGLVKMGKNCQALEALIKDWFEE